MKTTQAPETRTVPGQKDGRGRRPTFTSEDRSRLAELIREHGIRETQRRAGVRICINTLIKIGREFNIQLPPGRRCRPAA